MQEATTELARAERAAAPAAHRARAGVRAQVAVPREHVARVPHAAERDPGLHPHAAAMASPVRSPIRSARACRGSTRTRRHLLALINDILDITRIEAGRMPLNVTTFAIPELVDEVMAELEPIIKRSKLTVRPAMPRRPAAAQERPAEGEADRAEPAEQRAEVHAQGSVTVGARARRERRGASRSRSRTPASASRSTIRRRCSRTSGSWTTRRRADTAAPAWACRSAAASPRCSADASTSRAARAGLHFHAALPTRMRRR